MDIREAKLYQILENRQSDFLPNIEKLNKYVEDILPQIINVFSNYTKHDINHSISVMNYMYEIIEDVDKMNDLEITIMIYTALLHDIGMVVTYDEIKQIKADDSEIIECKYSVVFKELNDEILALQECIRPIHAKRSSKYIAEKINKDWFVLPHKTNINFLEEVQKICQSHNESFEWLKSEISQSKVKDKYEVNSQYIALLLRLSDLLDIDEIRTPMHLYQLINPKDYSDVEWRQHFVIDSVKKIYLNENTKQKIIRFYGESSDAKIHRKLLKYFDYINKELLDAVILSDNFADKKYAILFKTNIENKIQTKTFTFSDFKLELDYNAVTKLLMGEHIYGDKKFGLRELVQNSIDACKLLTEISLSHKDYRFIKYQPFINIIFDKDKNELIIADNGIGMSLEILQKYFLNVGVSYYSSNEYRYKGYSYNPIGNYGIGFLACFMLSTNVIVKSKRFDDQKLNEIELEKNSEYICLTQADSNRLQGTEIILDLEQFCDVFTKDINKTKEFIETNFIDCNIPISIVVYENGKSDKMDCRLRGLQANSQTIARLDKYLNEIEGFIELNYNNIGFVEKLSDFEGDPCYVYSYEEQTLINEDELDIEVTKFVKHGTVKYLKIPIIPKDLADKFKNYLDVLEDFDEALDKLSNLDYIEIFCEDTDELKEGMVDSREESIIGDYLLKDFCKDHGHAFFTPTYLKQVERYVVNTDAKKILQFELKEGFGKYSWESTEKIFIKNVLVPQFRITLPYLIEGINLKASIFNIKSKLIIPNVSRNNVQKSDAEEFSYAIGKALHLWILDNAKLDFVEKELLHEFIEVYYKDNNKLLRSPL